MILSLFAFEKVLSAFSLDVISKDIPNSCTYLLMRWLSVLLELSDSLVLGTTFSASCSLLSSSGSSRLFWPIFFTEPSQNVSSVKPSLVILEKILSFAVYSFPAKYSPSFVFYFLSNHNHPPVFMRIFTGRKSDQFISILSCITRIII